MRRPVAAQRNILLSDQTDALRAILSAWSATREDCRTEPVERSGFSGAGVFRTTCGSATFCLRCWPDDRPPTRRLCELHRFLAFMHDRGVTQLAVPAATETGSTLVEHEARVWQLEPWKPGTANFAAHPSAARLADAMRVLARLHLAAAGYAASPAGSQWFFQQASAPAPAVSERQRMIRKWDANRVRRAEADLRGSPEFARVSEILRCYRQCAPTVAAELQSLENVGFRLHPCLRDVWHDHLLFTGETLTGLIDPSAARSENVASDLSRLLGSLLGDDRPRWESALDAYAAVRPLTGQERKLIRTLDRSGVLLSPLHWIDRLQNGSKSSAPRLTPNEWSRLSTLATRLRRLAESVHTR